MGKLDRLGRGTFLHIAPQGDVCPTNREIDWFRFLLRHGPQSSVFLHALTANTHRCRDTSLRSLQRLRAGGFLALPPQQRQTDRAECQSYIYDLTEKSRAWLSGLGLLEDTIRPTGHWWHAYAVASVTAALEITGTTAGLRFVPAHVILGKSGARLPVTISGRNIIPDQLFALDYGGSFRAFVLEVDRNTEPLTSPRERKTLAASLDAYARAQATDTLRTAYGLKSPLLVLWVMNAPGRATFLLDRLARCSAAIRATHLVLSQDVVLPERMVPERYLHGPWLRAGFPPVSLAIV